MNPRNMLLFAVSATLLSACVPPRIMIAEHYIGDTPKVARHSLQTVATQQVSENSSVALQDYYIQVCDVQQDGTANCKTTRVLENVATYIAY